LQILIAGDGKFATHLLERTATSQGHAVSVAEDGIEAWSLVQQRPFDVVISDWIMPGLDGLELCQRVRGRDHEQYTYFILLIVRTAQDVRFEALGHGVDDFLTKPFDDAELRARLDVAQRIVAWEAELRATNEKLRETARALMERTIELDRQRARAEYLAEHDPLTGLLNRRAWFSRAANGEWAAIALFDIDHFKAINDTFGHPVGDAVLAEVASRIAAVLGQDALIARVGGEEFAVALRSGWEEAVARCDDVIRAVASSTVVTGEDAVSVTISAGLTMASGSIGTGYRIADDLLYQSKQAGRNRLTTASVESLAA